VSLESIARGLEWLSEWTGRIVAWLVLAMVLLVCYDVVARYLFDAGSIALQELEWHLFALVFLLGAGYTLRHDEHVRVDVLHHAAFMTGRRRAWVDLIGGLLFLIPFCVLVIDASWPFVANAYRYHETSPDPGGLTHRWLLKAAIPVGFGLLTLQGVASVIRAAQRLRRHEGDG
jgi:TRAP-type mannitol/chloroaromatic compound transport system permease small subunit